ncbi:hypothetical protein [Methylocystis bryophila]|uniref:Uncharacterized protein n=1 Tax=Methylocystis bryophila TaxID=655015 RepID=A0A1W6MTZ9_9HYPH|nr:hypothetical protein [Methylocystis bryophila]ARN80996.1 hypothetical protein B1812_07840 [Methylocystis bryophila]BDV36911.1 hypothetical protein DSM21852_01640 [Methylocystis bryophila]
MTASPFAALREEPGCVNPVPAEITARGFRLLTLRCYHSDSAPPSFAWIDQRIFRAPNRASRHGLNFGLAFQPEIASWLIDRVGRASLAGHYPPQRNPEWPTTIWRSADRRWDDGMRTTEWFAEVTFASQNHAEAFEEKWRRRLAGGTGD